MEELTYEENESKISKWVPWKFTASTQETDHEEMEDTLSTRSQREWQATGRARFFLYQRQPRRSWIPVVEHTSLSRDTFMFSCSEPQSSETGDPRCVSLLWHNLFSQSFLPRNLSLRTKLRKQNCRGNELSCNYCTCLVATLKTPGIRHSHPSWTGKSREERKRPGRETRTTSKVPGHKGTVCVTHSPVLFSCRDPILLLHKPVDVLHQ